MIFLDAGTTYSKILIKEEDTTLSSDYFVAENNNDKYYIVPSSMIKQLNLNITKSCGHMVNASENEIIALANGCKNFIDEDSTILDLGSRDAKWIRSEEHTSELQSPDHLV